MTALDDALSLRADGWRPIPIPYGQKKPVLNEWQKLILTADTLPDYFNGAAMNVGTLNGTPSGPADGGRVDVDLDSDEAVAAAPLLLPRTDCISGRGRRPRSHYWYDTTDAPPAKAADGFNDPMRSKGVGGWKLLELRSTGSQTVLPPSSHPDGDQYGWDERGAPARITTAALTTAVRHVAAAALLARYWPGATSHARHEGSLAVAGFLLRGGLDADAAGDIIYAAAVAAGDEEASARKQNVSTTAARLTANEEATGYTTAAKLLPPQVLHTIADWLGLARAWKNEPPPSSSPDDWPARQPLSLAPSAPALLADMVPEPFRDWLTGAAEQACLPLECFAAPVLVALSAVVGRAVGIRPWDHSDYTVVPNLWGALVARPGAMKTNAIAEALRPLNELAATARERYRGQAARAKAAAERCKAEIEGLKKRVTEASKKGASTDDLEAQIADKFEELERLAVYERRYVTNDPTIEKLGELLQRNPRGLLVNRDELTGFLRNNDRPGHEGDRAFYLEGWNGTSGYTFDRIGRGTVHVEAVTLSVLGGIQPGPLSTYVREAIAGGTGADGLLQRLQLLVWPDALPAWKHTQRWPDAAARQHACDVFRRLDELEPGAVGAVQEAGDAIPYVRFLPDAQALANRWRDELEARLRSEAMAATPAFEGHLAKYRSLFPALALLFYLVAAAAGGAADGVPLAAAQLAAAWCEYLEEHARKLYAAEVAPGLDAAHALAEHIQAGDVRDGQSVRELYLPGWSGLASVARVDAALTVLADAGWLRLGSRGTGGRPSRVVSLHPDFAEAGND